MPNLLNFGVWIITREVSGQGLFNCTYNPLFILEGLVCFGLQMGDYDPIILSRLQANFSEFSFWMITQALFCARISIGDG